MESIRYKIPNSLFKNLFSLNLSKGKSSHIGDDAYKIVESYFLTKSGFVSTIEKGKNGADMAVHYSNGKIELYEIKGTEDEAIAWSKLKVSSQACYNGLIQGMILIRVTSIGSKTVTLHFMKYKEDFNLKPEARWSVTPVNKRL
jgi:hypothetical protein